MVQLKEVTWDEFRDYLKGINKKDIPVTNWMIQKTDKGTGTDVIEKNPYDEDDLFYVLLDDGKPVASCNINVGEDNVWIGDFQVFKSYQGKRYGTTLFNHLRAKYRDKVLRLNYLPTAKTFWERVGFQKVPKTHMMELVPLNKKR